MSAAYVTLKSSQPGGSAGGNEGVLGAQVSVRKSLPLLSGMGRREHCDASTKRVLVIIAL